MSTAFSGLETEVGTVPEKNRFFKFFKNLNATANERNR